jgi:hypothetical protein
MDAGHGMGLKDWAEIGAWAVGFYVVIYFALRWLGPRTGGKR